MLTERDLPWLAAPLAALRDESRGHALILHGGAGSGLLELALRAAQAWLCEQPPGPCDACPSCHLSMAHSHPDLKVVLPETLQLELRWNALEEEGGEAADGEAKGKRKPSREIKVDQLRQAIDWAHSSSSRGRGKVLVFHPADAMNTVSANALLKTLEEPASGLRLILCVDDPERLLPTIRSRCQRVRLAPPEPDAALQWLRAAQVEDAATLLRAAGGEPLAARALRDAGLHGERWAGLPRRIAAGDVSAVSDLPVPLAVRALQQLCHDAMAVAAGAAPRYFPEGSVARPGDWAALSGWREALLRAARHDEHPWNGGLLLEALVAQGQHALTLRTSGIGKSPGMAGRHPPVGTLAS
jgi:DNA polymerase-3 subunit delta'